MKHCSCAFGIDFLFAVAEKASIIIVGNISCLACTIASAFITEEDVGEHRVFWELPLLKSHAELTSGLWLRSGPRNR